MGERRKDGYIDLYSVGKILTEIMRGRVREGVNDYIHIYIWGPSRGFT